MRVCVRLDCVCLSFKTKRISLAKQATARFVNHNKKKIQTSYVKKSGNNFVREAKPRDNLMCLTRLELFL